MVIFGNILSPNLKKWNKYNYVIANNIIMEKHFVRVFIDKKADSQT